MFFYVFCYYWLLVDVEIHVNFNANESAQRKASHAFNLKTKPIIFRSFPVSVHLDTCATTLAMDGGTT